MGVENTLQLTLILRSKTTKLESNFVNKVSVLPALTANYSANVAGFVAKNEEGNREKLHDCLLHF
jgi:hypothetical protein